MLAIVCFLILLSSQANAQNSFYNRKTVDRAPQQRNVQIYTKYQEKDPYRVEQRKLKREARKEKKAARQARRRNKEKTTQ